MPSPHCLQTEMFIQLTAGMHSHGDHQDQPHQHAAAKMHDELWMDSEIHKGAWATEYGPVTMIVPASGHQVRCIPWVQMGTFDKEIGFLCGLKFFALNIFCGEYLQSSLHLMLQIWWKPPLWKICQ